jgi:hypothetical protein
MSKRSATFIRGKSPTVEVEMLKLSDEGTGLPAMTVYATCIFGDMIATWKTKRDAEAHAKMLRAAIDFKG